jgi:hypothetical protein
MTSAKAIRVQPITPAAANRIVKAVHYSGKVAPNSQLHFGVFIDGKCYGAMQFGPCMKKNATIGLVKDTPWNGFLELNRMAFTDHLPRNSESRALSVAFRLIRKHYPHVQWIVSYSDATQCGDGTIYRAAGFVLTAIKENSSMYEFPSGDIVCRMTVTAHPDAPVFAKNSQLLSVPHVYRTCKQWEALGARKLLGHQLRYMYFLDPTARARLTVPELPFSAIDDAGARMYRGIARAQA